MKGELRVALASGLSLTLFAAAPEARAQSCEAARPTDASGTNGVSYGSGVTVSHLDSPSGRARVFYADSGPHAPSSMSAVTAAIEAAELAIETYEGLGYLAVISDEASPCPTNGGDGAIDIYLTDFRVADGQSVVDHCAVEAGVRRCSGFILVENDFRQGGYADVVEGMRTVVPHEIFHLVQDAYDASVERWWAEGSAQWAARRVYPELVDLERFLPAYFENPARPLDATAGVASDFLYATAIWPVYLSESFGDDLIRRIFLRAAGGQKVLAGTAEELTAAGSSLGAEFLRFAAFNAATGSRASQGQGYADAAAYPEVPVSDVKAEPGSALTGVGSGLGAAYFSLGVGGARKLTLSADPARVAASFLPFDGDGAVLDLDGARALPALVRADGIVVVAGQSTAKTDAPFSVAIDADGGGLEASSCSVRRVGSRTHANALALACAALGAVGSGRRRRRRH